MFTFFKNLLDFWFYQKAQLENVSVVNELEINSCHLYRAFVSVSSFSKFIYKFICHKSIFLETLKIILKLCFFPQASSVDIRFKISNELYKKSSNGKDSRSGIIIIRLLAGINLVFWTLFCLLSDSFVYWSWTNWFRVNLFIN